MTAKKCTCSNEVDVINGANLFKELGGSIQNEIFSLINFVLHPITIAFRFSLVRNKAGFFGLFLESVQIFHSVLLIIWDHTEFEVLSFVVETIEIARAI